MKSKSPRLWLALCTGTATTRSRGSRLVYSGGCAHSRDMTSFDCPALIMMAPSHLLSFAMSDLPHDYTWVDMPQPIRKNTIECCSTCGGLGYYAEDVQTRLKVLSDRSFDGFELSAKNGCSHCAVALQSFLLFENIVSNMQVELLLYPKSPTEMHSRAGKGQSEVLEIYPCPSKHILAALVSVIALTEFRTFSKCRVVMAERRQGCSAEVSSTSVYTVSTECIPNMHVRA
jgi:hypothetical protein